jgi:hypothetical protein
MLWGSFGFGLVGAALWFWSATIRLPTAITIPYIGPHGKVQELADKLRKASRINACAAALNGLSVLCQAIAALMGDETARNGQLSFFAALTRKYVRRLLRCSLSNTA